MEDLSVQVLNGYGIKAKSIRKSKLTYICATDQGTLAIKPTSMEPDRIHFIHSVKEYLFTRGFAHIDRFYKSTANKPYVTHNGKTYVMTDSLEGAELNFSDRERTLQMIRKVADMHKSGVGVPIDEAHKKKALCEDITNDYRKKIARMQSIKKTLANKSHLSDFDVSFIKNYDDLLHEANEAVAILLHSQYKQLKEKAVLKGSVCHNALKEENILFGRSDSIYITNFSESSVDHPVADLSELLIRYIRKHSDEYLKISEIIEAYDAVFPIGREEIEVLYGLLKFPNKIIKACCNYYSKRRTWAPSSIVNRFDSLMSIKEHHKEYIKAIR